MKTGIVLLLLCSFSNVKAQVNFGLKTGIHFSNLQRADVRYSESALNFHSGVVVDWNIDSSGFHLQGQLLYKPLGYKNSNIQATDADGMTLNGNIDNHRINYLEVPIHIQYTRDLEGVSLTAGAGPFFSFKTGDRMTLEGGEKFGNESAIPIQTKGINPILIGLSMQAGIEWNKLFCMLQYQRSFNGIYKELINNDNRWNVNVFSLSFGCYFGK